MAKSIYDEVVPFVEQCMACERSYRDLMNGLRKGMIAGDSSHLIAIKAGAYIQAVRSVGVAQLALQHALQRVAKAEEQGGG